MFMIGHIYSLSTRYSSQMKSTIVISFDFFLGVSRILSCVYVYMIKHIIYVILLAITYFVSSHGLKWTCQFPMISNYLYLLLAILSIHLFMDQVPDHALIFAILSLVVLIVVISIPSHQYVIKHLAWFVYLYLMAQVLTPVLKLDDGRTIVITIAIFFILSLIANIFSQYISLSWTQSLLMVLIAMIVVYLIGLFTGLSVGTLKILSMVGLFVFGLLILVDTKRLQMIDCGHPDYINNTMNLFLDVVNVFSHVQTLRQ